MKTGLLFVLIIWCFSAFVNGQDSSVNPVPGEVMREVVRRILVYKFKSPNRPKTVYLAKDGIDRSWLPTIPNIEFHLLSAEEIEDKETKVYFFSKPELLGKTYSITFAFGDPDCDYLGQSWNFRVSKNKVRLWLDRETGGGCGGGGEFRTAGQLNTYPNELKGYQFFDKGRLKGLKLAVSTKEDVKNNLGAGCESSCDFDENWTIYFTYFDDISKEDSDDKTTKYVPDAKYIGKLYSITLFPKRKISFSRIVFSTKFRESQGFSVGHNYDNRGRMIAAVGTSSESFYDRYGLTYTIFEEIAYTVGQIERGDQRKGDLISIEYTIPDKIEEKMFVEQTVNP